MSRKSYSKEEKSEPRNHMVNGTFLRFFQISPVKWLFISIFDKDDGSRTL